MQCILIPVSGDVDVVTYSIESNQFEKGIMTGQSTYFFSNGQIQKRFELDQYGRRHGSWQDYYSNGQLKEVSEYKNGEIILEKVKYDQEGMIIK